MLLANPLPREPVRHGIRALVQDALVLAAIDGVVAVIARRQRDSAYLLDHDYEGASGEFERALHHLDEAVALDPQGPLAQKIPTVKQKLREAQARLAQGRNLPPHVLEDLRQELKAVLP